jgi:predicted ATPase
MDDLVQRIHTPTEGNPYFATQLLPRLLNDKNMDSVDTFSPASTGDSTGNHALQMQLGIVIPGTDTLDGQLVHTIQTLLSPCAQLCLTVAAYLGTTISTTSITTTQFSVGMVKTVVTEMMRSERNDSKDHDQHDSSNIEDAFEQLRREGMIHDSPIPSSSSSSSVLQTRQRTLSTPSTPLPPPLPPPATTISTTQGSGDHRSSSRSTINMTTCKFANDGIQPTVYGLIPSLSRPSVHLRIGRILEQQRQASSVSSSSPSSSSSSETEMNTEWLRITTEQLNWGVGSITDQLEKVQLANLNLSLAYDAAHHSAFPYAAKYCRSGLTLLGDVGWTTYYDLTKKLSTLLAEAEYAVGNRDESQRLIETVLSKTNTLEDKIPVLIIQMEVLSSEGYVNDAIQVGLRVLHQLGFHVPRKVTKFRLLKAAWKTEMLLRTKTDLDLMTLPELTNQSLLRALEIMSLLGCYAYSANEPLFMLILSQYEMQIVVTEGLNKFAGDAFASHGVLRGHLGNVKEAFRFSDMSLKLMERFQCVKHDSQTLLVNHFFLQHLQKPLHSSIDPLFKSYQLGMEAGDIHNASLAFLSYICFYTTCGLPLQPAVDDLEKFRHELDGCSQELALTLSGIFHQSMLNLMGLAVNPLSLNGDVMQEDAVLAYADAINSTFLRQMLCYQKAILAVYFGDVEAAGAMAQTLWKTSDNFHLDNSCTFAAAPTAFLYAFSAIGLLRQHRSIRSYCYLRRMVRRHTKKLTTLVERQGNPNAQHLLLILHAEQAYLRKEPLQAVKDAYDKAIRMARRSGFTHHAALANERCGVFLLDYGDRQDDVQYYLTQAYILYSEWGALGKVEAMEDQHAFLDVSIRTSARRRRSTHIKGISRFHKSHSHHARQWFESSFPFQNQDPSTSATCELIESDSTSRMSML